MQTDYFLYIMIQYLLIFLQMGSSAGVEYFCYTKYW